MEFADDGFTVGTAEGERRVPWDEVTHVATGDDFWALRVKDGPELFLPASQLTQDMRIHIRTRTPDAKRVRRRETR